MVLSEVRASLTSCPSSCLILPVVFCPQEVPTSPLQLSAVSILAFCLSLLRTWTNRVYQEGYYSFALCTFSPVKFGTLAQKMTNFTHDF